jgi:hypothetical protein
LIVRLAGIGSGRFPSHGSVSSVLPNGAAVLGSPPGVVVALGAYALRSHCFVVLLPCTYFYPVTGVSVPSDGIIARKFLLRQVLFWGSFHWD